MQRPDDHLSPRFRCIPAHGGHIFTIALDPREAAFVLDRGFAFLDGVRYRVNLEGCTGDVEMDGRIMVRCEMNDDDTLVPMNRTAAA